MDINRRSFLKGGMIAAALKPALRRIHWAANLPNSFQTFWQTRAAQNAG